MRRSLTFETLEKRVSLLEERVGRPPVRARPESLEKRLASLEERGELQVKYLERLRDEYLKGLRAIEERLALVETDLGN